MNSVLNRKNVKTAYYKGKGNGSFDFNCWGATLFSIGYKNKLTWVNHDTMLPFLKNETVVILEENIQRGDILALYGNNTRFPLEHTAVYFGKGRFFHKRGSGVSELATKEEIQKIYWEADKSEIRRYIKNEGGLDNGNL